MLKEKPVQVVDLPDFKDIRGKSVGETIQNLYDSIFPGVKELLLRYPGQNKEGVNFVPEKIMINSKDYLRFLKKLSGEFNGDDRKSLSYTMIWFKEGPSFDKDIPEGKMYLYKGFVESNS